MENHTKLIESLSPNEIKVLPYLEESKFMNICIKSNLDKVAVLRALEYLQNKKILELTSEKKKVIEIGTNGALYKKKGLPERRLLNVLNDQRILLLKDAQQLSKLSDDEFKASIGVLKRKGLIDLNNGKIVFNAGKDEISKKSLEELFIDSLPLDYDSLTPEKINVLKSLQSRKDIVEVTEDKTVKIKVTSLGKTLMKEGLKVGDLIEQITPEILKKELLWKGKKFRRYDVSSSVPIINGGKRHFVNQAVDYARNIWTDMGFQEMRGDMIQSGFWNFDALFTAQDHPVREMQDTFFIKGIEGKLPDKDLVEKVKKVHEPGVEGSKGWQYTWKEEEAKDVILRTHTTCLSPQPLYSLANSKEKIGKY